MKRKYWFLITVTPLFLALDQISKSLIHSLMQLGEAKPIVQGWFELRFVTNTGMAFGFLTDLDPGLRLPLFASIAVVAVVLIAHLYHQAPERAVNLPFALSMILSGALGNLIDRVHWGYVVDFLQVHYKHYHWPTFNIADSVISIGIVLLIIDTIFATATDPEEQAQEAAAAEDNAQEG